MKLPQCYVLIEPLDVPATKHFKDVGETLAETLAVLDLNDGEDGVSDVDEDSDEDSDEGSDPETDIEQSLVPKRGQSESNKDKAMEKSLSDVLRTKII